MRGDRGVAVTGVAPPVALVAGGSGAIGATVVGLLVQRGFSVVATHRSGPPAGVDERVAWVRFDAGSDDPTRLREAVDRRPGPLRAFFFCIGAPSSKRRVGETPTAEFAEVYAANALSFVGIWRAVQEPARAGRARIVAVGSSAADGLGVRNAPYSAAKAALNAIVLTLAKEEYAHGVRANVVAPSLVDSPLAERLGRLAREADPAARPSPLPWDRALTLQEVGRVVTAVGVGEEWSYASGQVIRLQAAVR